MIVRQRQFQALNFRTLVEIEEHQAVLRKDQQTGRRLIDPEAPVFTRKRNYLRQPSSGIASRPLLPAVFLKSLLWMQGRRFRQPLIVEILLRQGVDQIRLLNANSRIRRNWLAALVENPDRSENCDSNHQYHPGAGETKASFSVPIHGGIVDLQDRRPILD